MIKWNELPRKTYKTYNLTSSSNNKKKSILKFNKNVLLKPNF